ncbi:IS transposase (plasmid) [Streptomyces sp. GBA 94-10 4N24]|nr:IS transposase [Streptomyces sp. GBA 94-10 4N24]UZN63118.1 IS transposase [Streptomyces sp. GBA 94-10 4N24]
MDTDGASPQTPRCQGLRLHPPRRWLRERSIPRKGSESSQRPSRHHWAIERSVSWLAGYRRHRPYERKADRFLAFTSAACTLICYRTVTQRCAASAR